MMRSSGCGPSFLTILFALIAMSAASPGAANPLDKAPPVDVCAMASPDTVRPVLTQHAFPIRATPEKPKPGRGICTWGAYDPGMIASAPAAAALVVEVYRSADAAWMAKNFAADFKQGLVPSQVRTDVSDDLVARPKPDTVAVRHGGSVVVVDASNQEYALQRTPDRIFRLEAFAFGLAGAAVRGPVDPRSIQDACTPLDPQHVLGVLTTEPSSLEISRDGTRCTGRVKDGSGVNGHWVDNRGEVQITREDVATNAAALRFQHQQTPFMPISTLVQTADPSDRLVTSSDHPGEVWAVHAANYVTLEVENETAAARSAPGWLYRVQRLAFEAAGATIVPTPGIPPDPVVPKLVTAAPAADAAQSWTPPAHGASRLAWLIDPIVAVIAFLAAYRFFLMPVWIILPIVVLNLANRGGRKSRLGCWAMLPVPLGIANIMFGTWLSTVLVYHAGVSGSAVVTASRATSIQYNNHDVQAHTVLIRTPDGKVVEAEFEDDDFNVYPSHNRTFYPGEGDAFTVRYLAHAPRTFVIVTNDDSPWARHLRCGDIVQRLSDANAKARFAPANADYKAASQRASAEAAAAGCLEAR